MILVEGATFRKDTGLISRVFSSVIYFFFDIRWLEVNRVYFYYRKYPKKKYWLNVSYIICTKK